MRSSAKSREIVIFTIPRVYSRKGVLPVAKQRKIPREFVPLDARFIFDEKLAQAAPQAELLFIRSLALCKVMDTDGEFTSQSIAMIDRGIRTVQKHIDSLVALGLWERVNAQQVCTTVTQGRHKSAATVQYRITSWHKWNITRAERLHISDAKSEAGRKGMHERHHSSKGVFEPDCEYCAKG